METNQNAAGLPAGAGRSRLIFPADRLQDAAEVLFIGAGQIEQELQPGQITLFADVLAIAVAKGFKDSDILRSLVRRQPEAPLVRLMTREVIELFGGAGDFWDSVDLITWPGEEGASND